MSRRRHRGGTGWRFRERFATVAAAGLVLGLLLPTLGSIALAAPGVSASASAPTASPTPEPLPSGPVDMGRAWLDQPLPTTASAGETIHVGFVVAQRDGAGLVTGATLRVRLISAAGPAEATQANGVQDWPGHYNATIEVPTAAVGRIEISLPGSFCNDNGCIDQPFLFEPVEVGPPHDLRLPLISTATIAVTTATITARTPASIQVEVHPRVAWPAPGLDLPATLIAQARVPQGPILQEVELTRQGVDGGHYAGAITIDEPGDVVLQVATMANPGPEDLFGAGLVRVRVLAAAASVAPTAAAGGGLPAWTPAALVVAVLGVAVVLVVAGGRRAKG